MYSKWNPAWDPKNITLSDPNVPIAWKMCVLQGVILSDSSYVYSGLPGRVAAIFVIFITSLLATLVPVLTRKSSRIRIPEWVYITAKNFGTGVIIATAIIHLVDPAMVSLGRNSCVGQTGNWASYRWCTAFMLVGSILTMIVDVYSQFFNRRWYGDNMHTHGEELFQKEPERNETKDQPTYTPCDPSKPQHSDYEFKSEFSRFLILEVGVVVHSVFIGLSLGSSQEWVTLFIVIIFHQAFEGLGIGARMSMIEFPKGKRWWPFVLSMAYSITTPVSIAFGILAHTSYRNNGFSQMSVQGICDALSCGIMMYTGFVELIARDFIFIDHSKKSLGQLNLQVGCILGGALLMSVVGKWA